MADRIQIRRDTAANWASANPVLAVGEQGYETDTRKMKIGNGSSTWNTLSYFADTASLDAATLDGLDSTDFATAAQGALADSAIQSADLATVATSGSYTDLSDQPSIPSITGLATETYVTTAVSNLVDTAPAALDTLNELAAALGDDADFAGTVTTSLATKANSADLATVATTGAYSDLTGAPTVPATLTDLSITDGTAGQLLSADGDGTYTFIDAASGGGGSFEAVASGSLPDGSTVVLNADGTVSAAGVNSYAADIGPANNNTGQTFNGIYSAAIPGTNSILVLFHGANNYLNAVVGSVANKIITFGTPAVISSGFGEMGEQPISYDPVANKFMVTSVDRSNGNDVGYAMVVTVTGNVVTVGTKVVVSNNDYYRPKIMTSYNVAENTHILSGQTRDDKFRIRTATISGTDVVLGAEQVITLGGSSYGGASVYDPSSQSVIIVYNDGLTARGNALIVTSSGGVCTLAAQRTLSESSWRRNAFSLVYEPVAEKIVFFYSHLDTNGLYTRILATDGSTITSTPEVLLSNQHKAYGSHATYNSTLRQIDIIYSDYAAAYNITLTSISVSGSTITAGGTHTIVNPVQPYEYGQSVGGETMNDGNFVISVPSSSTVLSTYIITPAYTASNLTAENYAGIADASYADAATATIQTAGSVDDAQSGLTPGQAYYVQADGTLGLDPATPSVFAGTAVSATKLLIGKEAPASSVAYADVTGTPDLSSYATETYVTTAVSNLVDTAPAALDTLNELAAALGDDADFAGTVTTSLAAKANSADLATVATTGAYSDLTGAPTVPAALTDLSITDGTAGQVLSADGDGTYTFIDAASGGSGGTASFTSTTNLTAGDLVALSTSGTVSGISTQEQVLHSSPVQPVGAQTKQYDNVSVARISDTKYVVAYRNSTGYPVVYIATVEADNTVTTGTQYTFSTATNTEGMDLFWDPVNERGVVVSTAVGQVRYQYFSVVGTAISYQGMSSAGQYANKCHAVYNYETNEIWVAWLGENYSARYGGLHKAVWNGSTIDITNYSIGFTLYSEKGYNIRALTAWGTDKVIGQWYDGNGGGYRELVFDTSTSTWNQLAFTSDIIQDLVYNSTDDVVLAINYSDHTKWWEYSVSGGVVSKGSFFPVAADVDGNPITWGTNDVIDAKFINGKTYILSQSVYEQAFMYSLERTAQNTYSVELVFNEAVPGSYDTGRMARDSFAVCGSGIVYVEGLSLRKLSFADLSVTNIGDFIGISTETVTANNPAVISIVGGINTNQSGLTPKAKYYATAVGALTTTLTDYPIGIATSATSLLVTESYTSTQKKTDLQLATVATTGAYSDLTGTPTGLATETYVDTAVSNLVDTAPAALDTLNELAAALNDDADFAGTVTTSLAAKANTADLATVATSGSYNDLTDQPVIAAGGGSFEAVASGSLSDGSTVILNADGTVSVIEAQTVPASFGTPTSMGTDPTSNIRSVFDSNSNKVVIIYSDESNSSYGTAIVGTVSGTGISFGTSAVYHSAATYDAEVTFDSNSNKIVINFYDASNSNYGTAIVGTISGTSISFGAPVVYNSAATFRTSSTFDSDSNKIVISYRDDGNSYYGTAIVGTVSGTSISFGTPVVFESAFVDDTSLTLDTNSNKIVIAYRNTTNSGYGMAIVGTVSGDSITFGTSAVFATTSVSLLSGVFDSNSNKIVIGYRDVSNLNYGMAIVGTVSGTSISFGTSVVFESARVNELSAVFDSNVNKLIIAYEDDGNTDAGNLVVGTVSGTSISFDAPVVFANVNTNLVTAVFDSNSNRVVVTYETSSDLKSLVYQPGYVSGTNLTAENYAGIADAAYADAATATIQTAGSVDDAQSGLTPGQAYYVQGDGTLGLDPDTPRVFAGVAASATKLLIGKEGPAADLSSYASTSYVDTAVSNLVDTAPEALNTLNELAAALNDEADFAVTVTASLSTKLGTDGVIDGGTV